MYPYFISTYALPFLLTTHSFPISAIAHLLSNPFLFSRLIFLSFFLKTHIVFIIIYSDLFIGKLWGLFAFCLFVFFFALLFTAFICFNFFLTQEHKIEAIDSDKTKENRNIRYQLIGPGSEKFSLHAVSGLIRVKNPASIDCELKCEYQLKVSKSTASKFS